jgi:hypothetical protein
VKSLKIVCGASRMTLGREGHRPEVARGLVRGDKGTVRLDAAGAKTSGQDVTASAKMVNEIKGPLVMISDTPGAVDPFLGPPGTLEMVAGLAEQLH